MLVVHLKSFECKILKLTESFRHGPCASLLFLCDHCSLVFVFFFSFLSLGFALHYIHAFHSRCFFLFNIKKKKKGKKGKKKEAHYCSCTILFVFKNKVGQFIFT